jgi:hypothetical protein
MFILILIIGYLLIWIVSFWLLFNASSKESVWHSYLLNISSLFSFSSLLSLFKKVDGVTWALEVSIHAKLNLVLLEKPESVK